MGFPVTIPGGSTWTADDFEPFTYPTSFPEIINEFVTYAESTEAVIKAGEAAASATAAAASQTAAAASATTASTGATTATTKAGEASTSASAAAGSATTASTAATTATTQAGIATTGANTATSQAAISTASAVTSTAAKDAALVAQAAASASAVGAATSETNAAASAAAASTSASLAAASAGVAGSGPATTLLYPALNKILATATDIVDVMVYDTRQDSDGGAWRFKCEHTSWYQETLNVANFRGARREFPAVAALVLRNIYSSAGAAGALTIYDLTDLDGSGNPRMWAVFNTSAAMALRQTGTFGSANNLTSVFALNGRIWVGAGFAGGSGTGGLSEIDLPGDTAFAVGGTFWSRFPVGLSQRNTYAASWTGSNNGRTSAGIVDRNVFHVHARVHPGAALDAAGLPIPTVAVATAGGTSVIYPNGAVYDITNAGGHSRALLLPDGRLAIQRSISTGVSAFGPLPYADAADSSWWAYYIDPGTSAITSAPFGTGGSVRGIVPGAIGTTAGVAFYAEDLADRANSMVSYASIAWATGWQPGAIRLATLCDATTGNITGSNLLNLDGSSVAGLAAGGANTLASVSGEIEGAYVDNAGAWSTTLTVVAGQTYYFRGSHRRGTSSGNSRLRVREGGTSLLTQDNSTTSSTTLEGQFTPTTTSVIVEQIYLGTPTTGQTLYADNIRVDLAVPDRSFRGKGLIPVGTLSRTAVAAGADMVAHSGFTVSNYYEQPYNADLDFGTGDFFYACWVKTDGLANRMIFDRSQGPNAANTGNPALAFYIASSGLLAVRVTDGTAAYSFPTSPSGAITDTSWHLVGVARRAGTLECWLDGSRVLTTANSFNFTNTTAKLSIGNPITGLGVSTVSVAMFRAGAYAPTPAQIARMYRDELPLFQPGVKCLLGGTSNAVADMDFDTTRNELIVGTADGVSEFSGLVRTSYIDTVSSGVLTNDNMRAVASQSGYRLLAGGAQSVALRDAVNGIDEMTRARPPAPERFIMRAVTTDATPTNLAPRIPVGERELVRVRATVTARQTGAAGTDRASYEIVTQAFRDAGGNVTLDIAAANQGVAGWGTAGPAAITRATETTSTMDAVWVVDTASQTLTVQVTGRSATRLEWTASNIAIERITSETAYAPIAA